MACLYGVIKQSYKVKRGVPGNLKGRVELSGVEAPHVALSCNGKAVIQMTYPGST
jgi:hypothetical protein